MTWKYIQGKLTKRGVRILNFSADGDSRLIKSMTTTFLTPDQLLNTGKAISPLHDHNASLSLSQALELSPIPEILPASLETSHFTSLAISDSDESSAPTIENVSQSHVFQ